MTTVAIKVKNSAYARKHVFAFPVPEYNHYVGDMIPKPKWVGEDFFCITTDEVGFPFRTIAMADVVEVEVVHNKAPEPNKATYQVKGKNDKVYLVKKNNSLWTCNCTGFSYRKTCSHVDEVRASH